MYARFLVAALATTAVVGCSTLDDLPPIPEFHPASAGASEGRMAPSFKVLTIVPELPPDLPVPEGEHKPPMNMQHGDMHGGASSGQSAGQERADDNIMRGEAQMPPIVIPSEQRGMKTDATLYHEHEEKYSTRIVHPARDRLDEPVMGPQVWACPRHPDAAVHTPGGRCPKCDTILVPVKAAPQMQGAPADE